MYGLIMEKQGFPVFQNRLLPRYNLLIIKVLQESKKIQSFNFCNTLIYNYLENPIGRGKSAYY